MELTALGLVLEQESGAVGRLPLPSQQASAFPSLRHLCYFLAWGQLVGGRFGEQASSLAGSPAAHSRVYSPGHCLQGLQAGGSERFIGISTKMRAVGDLWAFQSLFIGMGLPDAAGSSHFQGIWFLCLLTLRFLCV
jgi:hypothetical protein